MKVKTSVRVLFCRGMFAPFAVAAMFSAAAVTAEACTAIVAGKKASATGHVLIGHNEDGTGMFMRHAMLPPGDGKAAVFWSEAKKYEGGDQVGACVYSERGVFVVSNNGGVMQEWDGETFSLPDEGPYSALSGKGIGYDLRFRAVERAHTARECVDIMIALVKEHGYNQQSRNFLVADSEEAWILEVLNGRRYIARRVPDDEVVVYPNCLVFSKLRPGDLASENIKSKGPDFDIIGFYQGPRTWKSPYNLYRWKEMYRIAAGVELAPGAEYPFSVRPAHPISANDIKRGLRTHYEGRPYEVKDRHPKKDPKIIEPICRHTTLQSLVCEMNSNPKETAMHLTVGRPCEVEYGVYRPFGGVLPDDTAFGEKAVARLVNHELPPVEGRAAAPLGVSLALNGDVRLGPDGPRLSVTLHREGWNGTASGVKGDWTFPDPKTGTATFDLADGKTVCASARATLVATVDRRAALAATVESLLDQTPESLVLSLSLKSDAAAGRAWSDGSGKSGTFPKEFSDKRMCVYSGTATSFTFENPATGRPVTLTFPEKANLMLQDDRKWVQTFTLRISPRGRRAFPKGDVRTFLCFISSPDGVDVSIDQPVVVARGPEWIPLDYRKNIEAGSALDFSGMGLQDAPAGKYGWLRNANGHFEFEKRPGVHQRFYGVNLCFSASFPDQALADELVTRLVRLGYNTVRIHHYENWDGVIKGSKDRLTFNEEWTKRLDYLLYRATEKGIYVTTDLFTTRPVMWRDIAIDRDGQVPMQVYKNLIGVHAPAFENWKTFSRNLLTHVNPYTGRAYKDEPGLPLISLINEGHLTWCWESIKKEAPMKAAWKKWLLAKRAADPAFAKGVSDDAEKVPAWNNAALIAFMADVEGDLSRRQREFLRVLGVKALLTSQNCGGHYTPLMAMREERYDYVDDHFYVDHPQFLIRPWSLPSKCPNANPVFSTSLPPVACAYTRMPSKPFCITEWNFSGPGMFRGVGGIMTGAMGALQDWDGLWRFAYSHSEEGLRDRKGLPGYFDVAGDPLGQASDRASVCLFLRGDMAPLADKLALAVTPDTFMPADGRPTGVVPKWRDAAWQTQVATAVAPAPAGVKTFNLGEQIAQTNAPVSLAANPAIAFDRTVGSFCINTPRTAGGFTPKGALSAGPVSFDVGDVAATVWASSLDGNPIAQSSRILVTHLTDVQADGNVYADRDKRILLKWGAYPPVVRAGQAKVSLALNAPDAYDVWVLDTTGRRLAKLPASVTAGRLAFAADVKGPNGACMLYEVVRAR